MNKEIEKNFFKAFEFGGTVNNCIDCLRHKYDLCYMPARTPEEEKERLERLTPEERENQKLAKVEWEHFDTVLMPEKIRKETEAFDDSAIMFTESPLMEEIENNLNECQTEAQQERYLFSLLTPFNELSNVLHPTAEINRLETTIEECKRDKKRWQSRAENEILTDTTGKPTETLKGQTEACDSMVRRYQKEIDRIYFINKRFCEIIGEQINEKGSVEWCLECFVDVANRFANRLDALLLTYGIDLMRLQKESGIYLKSHRLITDVDFYIGSRELAERYIDALPKVKKQTTSKPQQELSKSSKRTNIDEHTEHFNSSYSEVRLGNVFKRLKDCGYLNAESDLDTWLYICGAIPEKKQIEPLKWTKDQELLAHLVDMLFGGNNVNRLWVITKQVFTINGKVPNTDTMKNTISKIKRDWKNKPYKFNELEKLLTI